MNTPSKFFLSFSKILAPTQVAMGRSVISPIKRNVDVQKSHFSQKSLNTGLDVSITKLEKDPTIFYMDTDGNLLSSADRQHLHSSIKTEDGKTYSTGLYTTHPQSKSKVFNTINLGKGTVENANSTKDQYIGIKNEILHIPKGLVEVPQCDSFLQEVNRMSQIEPTISNKNFSTVQAKQILQVSCIDPEILTLNVYGNDKNGKAFRELLKNQVLEQLATGEVKKHHIVKIIKD